MIKQIITLFAFIFCTWVSGYSQPISNDTVVCVVDTTNNFVEYQKEVIDNADSKCLWNIKIKCHYYDTTKPDYKDIASVFFSSDEQCKKRFIYKSDFNGPFKIKVSKRLINKRYIVATDDWINQQTNECLISRKIGWFPRAKYNFVIFKQDLDNEKTDSVIMYWVLLEYGGIEE